MTVTRASTRPPRARSAGERVLDGVVAVVRSRPFAVVVAGVLLVWLVLLVHVGSGSWPVQPFVG